MEIYDELTEITPELYEAILKMKEPEGTTGVRTLRVEKSSLTAPNTEHRRTLPITRKERDQLLKYSQAEKVTGNAAARRRRQMYGR